MADHKLKPTQKLRIKSAIISLQLAMTADSEATLNAALSSARSNIDLATPRPVAGEAMKKG